ncbi:MAG TPA: sulfate adenylyltransferase [Firmicutes bacterium]|nr:sulfate adenylyltransferase [Bacillota bacterium]
MSKLVPPHGGGELTKCLVPEEKRAALLEEAKGLEKIFMSSKEVSDLVMLAAGFFCPLEGFMTRKDYENVVEKMQLANGVLWPIPITLSVDKEKAASLKLGQRVALVDSESNETMGVLTIEDIFEYDKQKEAQNVFGTVDENHPGVQKCLARGDVYVGGKLEALSEGGYRENYPEYARPEETRAIFEEKGWQTITAFQTRNPIHRSHEYLTKIALEISDGIFIHPIVGKLKADDIPADVRMKCYNVLIENYYPKENVVLKVYPMEMYYAGPKEALLHAIIRQNCGCSHLVIGRDHAGVGKYYGPFDAQKIFETIPKGSLAIQPMKIDWTFHCYKCNGMASMKTCPHSAEDRLLISGTKLRQMLSQGEKPAAEFSRPEVLDILIDYYASKK